MGSPTGAASAAALVLGAAGAVIGTRFQATVEALVAPEVAEAIVDGRGDDTERSRVLDIARERAVAGALHGPHACATRSSTAGGAARPSSRRATRRGPTYRTAADRGDLAVVPVWAGEAVDLITDVPPAADLVARIAGEAEEALIHAGSTMIRP